MIKVMFVCLGNICRSPMAEFVLKDMVKKQGLKKEFFIKSSATSSEEIGNDIHYGSRDKLIQNGISFTKRKAVKLRAEDYKKYDYIIGMEKSNVINIKDIIGGIWDVWKYIARNSIDMYNDFIFATNNKINKNKKSEDLSINLWVLWAISSLAYTLYAVICSKDFMLIFETSLELFFCLLILMRAIKYRENN